MTIKQFQKRIESTLPPVFYQFTGSVRAFVAGEEEDLARGYRGKRFRFILRDAHCQLNNNTVLNYFRHTLPSTQQPPHPVTLLPVSIPCCWPLFIMHWNQRHPHTMLFSAPLLSSSPSNTQSTSSRTEQNNWCCLPALRILPLLNPIVLNRAFNSGSDCSLCGWIAGWMVAVQK